MSTRKLSNVNELPRMRPAHVPDGMVLRVAEGTRCRCGQLVRNYPEPLNWPGSFRLICEGCHRDLLCYEPHP